MPRMSKKHKEEWALFLDARGRKAYCDTCRKCERECKQSFRAMVLFHIIRNHSADYIWAFSFSSLILIIGDWAGIVQQKCIIIGISLVTFSEIIQLIDIIPLTFDVIDMVVQLVGLCCAVLLFNICFVKKAVFKFDIYGVNAFYSV